MVSVNTALAGTAVSTVRLFTFLALSTLLTVMVLEEPSPLVIVIILLLIVRVFTTLALLIEPTLRISCIGLYFRLS